MASASVFFALQVNRTLIFSYPIPSDVRYSLLPVRLSVTGLGASLAELTTLVHRA
jgi:hypothetical protein